MKQAALSTPDVLSGHRIVVSGSTTYHGQSGGALVANTDNASSLETGDNLDHSYILGVVQGTTLPLGGDARGIYFEKAQLDWILSEQASSASSDDLPFVHLFGSSAGDAIDGTALRDYIQGGDGADTINGGAADDIIYGGPDGDTISGGDGDDFLDGGTGVNTLDGGDGSDTVSFLSLTNGLTVDFSNGAFTHSSSDNTVSNIENFILTDYVDTLTLHGSDGLFATAGGDDLIEIDQAEASGPYQLYLNPGAGADQMNFVAGELYSHPDVVILGADSSDVLRYDGLNVASFIANAEHSQALTDGYIWYNLGGGPEDNISQALEIDWDSSEPGADYITYAENDWSGYPSVEQSGLAVTVMGFESGDFGISATLPSWYTAADYRDTLEQDFSTDTFLPVAQSDHVWDLLGLA